MLKSFLATSDALFVFSTCLLFVDFIFNYKKLFKVTFFNVDILSVSINFQFG